MNDKERLLDDKVKMVEEKAKVEQDKLRVEAELIDKRTLYLFSCSSTSSLSCSTPCVLSALLESITCKDSTAP